MTDEKLLRANKIKHDLGDVEEQMEIIAETEEHHYKVAIRSEIGSVTLDDDTRDQILGIVLNSLVTRARELNKEFEEL